MSNIVKQYLEKKRDLLEAIKGDNLVKMGLFEKEYLFPGEKSTEYPYIEKSDFGKRYYKKVPILVTDKEYDEIVRINLEIEKNTNLLLKRRKNISLLLNGITAVAIIATTAITATIVNNCKEKKQ